MERPLRRIWADTEKELVACFHADAKGTGPCPGCGLLLWEDLPRGSTRLWRPVPDPPKEACEVALAAARAAGAALVGVDLVRGVDGSWIVIELNGAVEFTSEYQPAGDVFSDVAGSLARHAFARLASRTSASAAA